MLAYFGIGHRLQAALADQDRQTEQAEGVISLGFSLSLASRETGRTEPSFFIVRVRI